MENIINVSIIKRELAHCWVLLSRIFVLALCFALGFAILITGAKKVHAATLKSSVTLEDGALTVSDLFDGVDDRIAEYVLGPGPKPGENMTLNARTLQRVAIAMDMDWRPSSNAEQITIHRSATIIETGDILDAIRTELENKGLSGNFKISLVVDDPRMTIPATYPATVDVQSLRFSAGQERFTARLKAPSAQNALAELTISGTVKQLVSVPVVVGTIQNDDIIRQSDIAWIDVPEESIQHNTILKAEELIGMTARRLLMANRPIRNSEVIQPQVIKRGEFVTITFQHGPLLLTAEGKAMENGAKNDIIRVVNTESSRAIEARVTGEKSVIVR